jgi:hypothetical protein
MKRFSGVETNMRILAAALVLGLLAGSAHAQVNMMAPRKQIQDPHEAERQKKLDRDYQDASAKVQAAQPATNDPWASVRAAEQPAKPAPKVKPKTQAQSTPR